jgi:hypothetical protein
MLAPPVHMLINRSIEGGLGGWIGLFMVCSSCSRISLIRRNCDISFPTSLAKGGRIAVCLEVYQISESWIEVGAPLRRNWTPGNLILIGHHSKLVINLSTMSRPPFTQFRQRERTGAKHHLISGKRLKASRRIVRTGRLFSVSTGVNIIVTLFHLT